MRSWNEIRKAATAFSKRWKGAYDEKSQAQSFLKEFFEVFGVDTVTQATFEHRVKFSDGSQGFVDCFWPSTILVEMKSKGKDLDAAYSQAMDYVRALPDQSTLPRAIVVSDFQTFRFYDLTKDGQLTTFKLADLRKYVTLFGYMIGGESEEIREQDPVNRKAAEKMAKLHDALKAIGYQGRELEVYLVRLLFCLFAEDTSIFKQDQFSNFIRERTSEDGSDLAIRIAELFQVLNTAPEKRLATRDEAVAAFPYVNGNLFGDQLQIPAFSAAMRTALLECGALDWSKISPAIFGAMFQGVMDETKRHDLGAHYTSEENILKVIRPLFLDRLREEFDTICLLTGPSKRVKLQQFHDRIAALKFLDPACGCGNFLLIAYRELRRLEMDVLEELHKDDPGMVLDVSTLCKVNVSQFYGIEIEQFPAEIAKVALWLMDHLCNLEVADRFGQYFARIPIKASPHIVCANALTTDWGELLKNSDQQPCTGKNFDFIMGNPPFLGAHSPGMDEEKRANMAALFPLARDLDFVCGWYKKANDLIQGASTRCAFVSTNSISQGEQVALLWKNLNAEIDFAYRTFKWHNEAKGNAAVHCVIVGFHAPDGGAKTQAAPKLIFDGNEVIHASHINGYLMDAADAFIDSPNPITSGVEKMTKGSQPTDGGNLSDWSDDQRNEVIAQYPNAAPLFRLITGSDEYINKITRWCLWLKDVSPAVIRTVPPVMDAVERTRQMRLASKKPSTRNWAKKPTLFTKGCQPESGHYIIVPSVSSQRREYIPMGFLGSEVVVNNLALFVPNATLYDFGVLTSRAHMAWVRVTAGRMKSDYRYSAKLCYNSFVWPKCTSAQKERITATAQAILDARSHYPDSSLADMYDPLTMPPDLRAAHEANDRAVLAAYGLPSDTSESKITAHLFDLYAAAVK